MPKQPNLDTRLRVERRRDQVTDEDTNWDDDPTEWQQDGSDWSPDASDGDGAGNFEGDFVGIGPAVLRCELAWRTLGAVESVEAGKLRGSMFAEVKLRVSRFTRQITTDDRFRLVGTDTVLNIRAALPPGREHFLTFVCEAGVAT